MRHTAFIVATLSGSLLFGASVVDALRMPGLGVSADAASPQASASRAGRAPTAPAQAQLSALAAAIEDQFPGHAVDVALAAPAIVDLGPAQQEVQALARVRIDGSTPMLVRANALYDRQARSVAAPSLWFEGSDPRPVSEAMRRGLANAAARRLDAE